MTSSLLAKITPHIALRVQEKLIEFFTSKGKRVIVMAGPTGVGKTAISLLVASMLDGEIISADSMQVYRGMDIGTAKVSLSERQAAPHHLIDIRDISDTFNAHDYFVEAKSTLDDILARGKVPIIVGGTGFYIHSLLYGPPSGPPTNPIIRQSLEEEAKRHDLHTLYSRLRTLDPKYAATVTPNDQHKIVRALEIMDISGQKVSDFSWKNRPLLPSYDFRCWFLNLPRDQLYEKLSFRCEEMINGGLLDEVRKLDKAGLRHNKAASQAIGYRQTLQYLDSAQTPEDRAHFETSFKQSSHHLAKRQFTWFRKEPHFRWLDLSTLTNEEIAESITSDYSSSTPITPEPPTPPAWPGN